MLYCYLKFGGIYCSKDGRYQTHCVKHYGKYGDELFNMCIVGIWR